MQFLKIIMNYLSKLDIDFSRLPYDKDLCMYKNVLCINNYNSK